MRQLVIKWAEVVQQTVLRHSWVLTALGIIFAAIGGVASNVTASTVLKPSCGEGQICLEGFRIFLLSTYEGWMILLGAALSISGTAISYKDKNEIDRLNGELTEYQGSIAVLQAIKGTMENEINASTIDVFKVFSLLLKQIACDCQLSVNERVSIYKVSETKFFIAGRYSENAAFNKVRRKYYERGHGLIEEAWKRGWAELEIRSSNNGNANNRKRYAEEHNGKTGIPAGIVKEFNMRSRSYKALSIKDHDLGSPIAIVCIESTERSGLAKLDRADLEARFNHLAILVEALEHHVASLDNAMSEGL